MKILRTPDERFANLPGYPFAPHYTEVPDGEGGQLRIHHVEEGPRDSAPIILMHGQPTWSYLYRHMIPILVDAGHRVLAPDLVGYGRSDKPAAREDYSYQRQVDWMTSWLVENEVRGATFFGQDWGGLIGLRIVSENPDRFDRVVISNTGLPAPVNVPEEFALAAKKFRREAPTPTLAEVMTALNGPPDRYPHGNFVYWQKWCWDNEDLPVGQSIAGAVDGRELSESETAAYDAPFPGKEFLMGPRAMPSQVPTTADDPSISANLAAWKAFSEWKKPLLCAFSGNDPVSRGGDKIWKTKVPGAANQPHQTIEGGGHFLQEGRGAQLAAIIDDFVKST